MNRIENDIYCTKDLSRETQNSFPRHYGQWGKHFISTFKHIYIALNVNELTYVIKICKSMFPTKNHLNNVNILYTGSHKVFVYV